MSDSEAASNLDNTPTDPAPEAPSEIKQDAASAAALRKDAESLLRTIQGNAKDAAAKSNEIEQGRLYVEQVKTEIAGNLQTIEMAAAKYNQQAEAARGAMADMTSTSVAMQAAYKKAEDASTQATAALETARTLSQSASDAVNRIEAIKTQVEQTAQVAATRSDHIEAGRRHADESRAVLDKAVARATAAAESAESQLAATGGSIEKLESELEAAKASRVATDEAAAKAEESRVAAEGHAATSRKLAQIATTTEARIAEYEGVLKKLQAACEAQRKTIEELLLGATNAGLASAFDKRSKTFKRPEMFWSGAFIVSLLLLLGLAGYEAVQFHALATAPTWDELGRMLLVRIPFLIPLIWLAIHSGRQASFAKRMEEEYAFKATLSTSFEGYRRQLVEVSDGLVAGSPLARFTDATIVNIQAPPGSVYDKHRMDPTPGTAAAEVIKPMANGVSKVIAAKPQDDND